MDLLVVIVSSDSLKEAKCKESNREAFRSNEDCAEDLAFSTVLSKIYKFNFKFNFKLDKVVCEIDCCMI